MLFSRLSQFLPKKIRYQLILGITLAYLLLTTIFVFDVVNRQRDFLKKQNHEQALSLADDFSVNAAPYVEANDYDGLERLVNSYRNFHNLKYAMLLSTNGVVLAHTNKHYIGSKATDSISRSLKFIPEAQTLLENNYILDVAVPVYYKREIVGMVRIGISQDYIYENLQGIIRNGFIYIILSIVVGVLCAVIIGNMFSLPLYNLIMAADQIRSGDRSRRVAPFRTYELSRLGNAFNQMLDDISAHERFVSTILENMPVGVWVMDEKGKVVSTNIAAKQIWNDSKSIGQEERGVYKGWFLQSGKVLEPNDWGVMKSLTTGEVVLNQEIVIECFDKSHKIILYSSMPIYDSNQKITGAIAIHVDITDRKMAEETLRNSEEKLRLIIGGALDAIVSFDDKGRFTSWNQQAVRLFGWKEDEILGKRIGETIVPESQRHAPRSDMHKYFTTGIGSYLNRQFEAKAFNKDGKEFNVEMSIIPIIQSGQTSFTGFVRDISERKKAEKELKDYKLALDQSSLVAITDENGVIKYVNENFCNISKFAPEELIGQSHSLLNSGYHPKSFFENLWQTISSGKIWRGEVRNRAKDGSINWLDTTIVPFMDDNGKPYQYVGIRFDISERKKADMALFKMNQNITKRVKELKCMYSLSELASSSEITMDIILEKCVDILPPAYQYPEITCTRILFNGKTYESKKFLETPWKQIASIESANKTFGQVEVFYKEEKPYEEEGPFLKEERFLIDSVADILSNYAERKNAEQEMLKLNRLYQFISHVNETILKLEDRDDIYSEACRIAVEYGNFRMAWIGLIDETEESITPHVWAGYEEGYLKTIKLSTKDTSLGRGPAGMAIRSRKIYFCNDIEHDPVMLPWREEALKRNYRSSIALPIIIDGNIVAVYVIFMNEPFFFNETEVKLLREVTDNISYALDKIRINELKTKSENELRESEEKFRSLVEKSQAGVYILQNDKFVYVNPLFKKIIGYQKEYILQEINFDQLVHEADVEMVKKNYRQRMSGLKNSDQYIFRVIRGDGEVIYVEVIVSLIFYNNQPASLGTIIDVTERLEEEQRISKAVTEAQERERMQIGMELHDNVKQIMAASCLSIEFALHHINNHQLVSETLNNVKSYVQEAIHELRQISHQLAPSVKTEDTLAQKIEQLVLIMNKQNKLGVMMDIESFDPPLSNDLQITFYRIIQEQFQNILKYAYAANVYIIIKQQFNYIELLIRDDGIGFDTNVKFPGIGLENIKRRASIYKGQVKIISSEGNGCEVAVLIPFSQ